MQKFEDFLKDKWRKYNSDDGISLEFDEWLAGLGHRRLIEYVEVWHTKIVNDFIDKVRKSIINAVIELGDKQ